MRWGGGLPSGSPRRLRVGSAYYACFAIKVLTLEVTTQSSLHSDTSHISHLTLILTKYNLVSYYTWRILENGLRK